jgi:glycosyltransferase involved in cell wall biosynthesis
LRVVHLSPSFLPIVGGTEVHIRNLSLFLKKNGVASEVITLSDKEKNKISRHLKKKEMQGIRTLIWPSYPLGKFQFVARLAIRTHFLPTSIDQLRKHLNTFDLLHFHDDVDLSFPLCAMHINKPKIFTCHSLPYWMNYYRINLLARSLFTRSASLYHVFSEQDKENLGKLGIPENKIKMVPHGVDLSIFKPPKRRISHETICIVFVGRIQRRKGIMDLLKAVEILKRTHSISQNIEAQIIGKVWDYQYYLQLQEYKRKRQLEEVNFIGFRENLPSLLQQADVFVCPSLQETFGIVNLEAMACRLPVVATRVGGIPEVIVDGKTGFLVPPNDPKSLAEKLGTLIADEKLRKQMGQEGRKRIETSFSMDSITCKIINIYKELVSQDTASTHLRVLDNERGSQKQFEKKTEGFGE